MNSLKLKCLIVFMLILALEPTVFSQEKIKVKICDKELKSAVYAVSKPETCSNHYVHNTIKCVSSVYALSRRFVQIPAVACKMLITGWSSVHYFFGAKTHETHVSVGDSPEILECMSWSSPTSSTHYGRLQVESKTVSATVNKPNITYRWPTGDEGQIANAIRMEVMLTYDTLTQRMSSNFEDISSCNYSKGACKLRKLTLHWKVREVASCPTRELKNCTTVLTHMNANHETVRVELPELAMSFRKFVTCEIGAMRCIHETVRCTPNGLFISTSTCETLGRINPSDRLQRLRENSELSSSPLLATLQELTDTHAHQAAIITDRVSFLTCQLERFLTLVLKELSRVNPNLVVKTLLEESDLHATVHGDDVIEALKCHKAEVTMKPSLFIDSQTMSARPIVEISNDKGNRFGQLYADNIVFPGTKYLEPAPYNGSRIFKVGDKYYKFEDGHLVDRNVVVQELHPHLHENHKDFAPENQTKDLIDIIMSTYGKLDRTLASDYNDLLLQVSQSFRLTESLKDITQTITDESDGSTSYNVLHPISTVADAISNSALSLLAYTTSPAGKLFTAIFVSLTVVWISYFTIRFLFRIPQYFQVLLKIRKKREIKVREKWDEMASLLRESQSLEPDDEVRRYRSS